MAIGKLLFNDKMTRMLEIDCVVISVHYVLSEGDTSAIISYIIDSSLCCLESEIYPLCGSCDGQYIGKTTSFKELYEKYVMHKNDNTIKMVRTFLCHPFVEPKGFADNFEPTAVCFPQNDSMIISSSNCNIQIYDLKQEDHPQLYTYPTTGVPVSLLYSDNKDFLVSLETRAYDYKPLKSQHDLNCQVYVYWNFHCITTPPKTPCLVHSEYTQNIKGNVFAGMYTHKFPVIDMGIYDPVMDIALCEINDNVAFSARNKVYIYIFKEIEYKPSNTDQIRLIDFFKMIEIDTSFHVRSLSICNDYLAFASRRELRVVQIYLNKNGCKSNDQSDGVSLCSETQSMNGDAQSKSKATDDQKLSKTLKKLSVDEGIVTWNFNATASGISPINLDMVRKEAPYADGSSSSKEVVGPIEDFMGHPFAISFASSFINGDTSCLSGGKVDVSALTLLYRRFEADEMSTSDSIDSLHSLQWLPTFITDQFYEECPDIQQQSWPWNCFQLPLSLTTCYMSLFFSTGMQGFLYNMSPTTVKKVVSYGYTSDCSMALHTTSFLYAVTKSGLEAYTSRLYPSVVEFFSALSKREKSLTRDSGETENSTSEQISLRSDYKGYCYDPLQHDKEFFDTQPLKKCISNQWCPGIPKYSEQALLLPCPSSDLEYCLVGLFALHNIQIVGTSSSFIGLLIKASKDKNDKQESPLTNWCVYNLNKAPICEFHNELVTLVEGNELSNPGVYHQLLCEGNLMLRSELTLDTPLKDKIQFYLRSSARKIAEFLSRCDSSFDVSQICEYFSMAGITFKDAVESFMENSSAKKSSETQEGSKMSGKTPVFGHGMMLYLNSVLFADHEIDLEKEHGDFILKAYLDNQPALLPKVILKSKLKIFSNDLAIKYINKHRKKCEAKGTMWNPFDCICLAVLQMRVGNPNKAESLLGEITEESLQKICERYEFILFDPEMQMNPFGQLVRKHFKVSFIAILVLMFEHGKIAVQQIFDLFLERRMENDSTHSYTVCEVLEKLLNDNSHKKHFSKISLFLAEQYINHLCKGTMTTILKSCHKHVPKGNGHFAPRFSWLNSMEPFPGEPSLSDDCKLSNSPALRARCKFDSKVICPCCCCNEILLKLQSILCSRHNRKDLSAGVLNKLSKVDFSGKESILLLCWPKSDFAHEAVECIVRYHSKHCLQYAREMFDWKAQWQLLLQFVLSVLKNCEYEQWNHDAYIALLKDNCQLYNVKLEDGIRGAFYGLEQSPKLTRGKEIGLIGCTRSDNGLSVLLRLARVYTPAEFLTFVPDDGMASFFLPYIHECWEYNKSTLLRQQFLDTYPVGNE